MGGSIKIRVVRGDEVVHLECSEPVARKIEFKHNIRFEDIAIAIKTSTLFRVYQNPHRSKPGREMQWIIEVLHPEGWPMWVVVRIFDREEGRVYKVITAYKVSRHRIGND